MRIWCAFKNCGAKISLYSCSLSYSTSDRCEKHTVLLCDTGADSEVEEGGGWRGISVGGHTL